MKKTELIQIIKEVLSEGSTTYVVVDLDRGGGAFYAGENNNESPFNSATGDVDGQWEHITNKEGEETGYRQDWETNFSTFPDRNLASAWAVKYLKNAINPATGKPFRFQILSYGEWGRDLNRRIKSIGTSRNKEFEPTGKLTEKEDFGDGLNRELRNAEKKKDAEKVVYYRQALRSESPAVASFDNQFKGSWAYTQWVEKFAKEIAAQQQEFKRFSYMTENKNPITKTELRQIINESVIEALYENSLPPGIPPSSIIPLDKFIQEAPLDEADMLGAKTTAMSPEDMQSYLGRTKQKTKLPTDQYKMPYVHPSNIQIKNGDDRNYDLPKLAALISTRPKHILKMNAKMQKSGGEEAIFFDIGLPALKGLAVNEKTGDFIVVDTCPGAGACKVYCYAKKGGYIQYKDASMSQTKLLNYLINDPEGFKRQFEAELTAEEAKSKKKGKQIIIRWHDAGDFFSPDYLNLAYDIARKFPEVKFYAYTKIAGVAMGNKPDNFVINFSMGATPEQEKQINFGTTKHSTVVPKPMFDKYMLKDEKGKLVRDEKNRMQFKTPEDLAEFKKALAAKYSVKPDSVLTYDEMLDTPDSNEANKYNVIVRPGDGDVSASRRDVKGTYLLIH